MTTKGHEMTAAENENWYMVNRDGMATLCTDSADAEKEAADAQSVWPHMGPHRAVRLVEASFDAADMATAAADGFRAGQDACFKPADMATAAARGFLDGAAYVAANAGEPVARVNDDGFIVEIGDLLLAPGQKLYLAAPPTAQAEVAKLKGQRRVLCDLLRECLPIIDAMLQTPGDDASDAHLQGLQNRINDALGAVAEERVQECMA